MLQRFSVVATTNIWILHCYNLFPLLQQLRVEIILLQLLNVVTVLLHRILCNCYKIFTKSCNNGVFYCYNYKLLQLQALNTPYLNASMLGTCKPFQTAVEQLQGPKRDKGYLITIENGQGFFHS